MIKTFSLDNLNDFFFLEVFVSVFILEFGTLC
jgi:hypothetical protein